MADPLLPVGKLPESLLAELLRGGPELPPEVRVGPAIGEDACVIDTEEGVLAAATDPITMTGSGVGRHAVLINANDLAVMGVRPRYFLCALLLPEGTRESAVRELFAELRLGLAEVGAVLVGGHSEVTPVVSQPLVVGQMLGTAPRGAYLASSGVQPGDELIQVGPAPVEGALVLALEAGGRLAGVPAALVERARAAGRDPGISIVEPALSCAELGAHALHDPTEGGLSAGLHELARASALSLVVRESRVLWFEPGLALCRALGADPWGTLASGTVLAAFPPERSPAALVALAGRGWPASCIGYAESGAGVQRDDGGALPRFERDELSRVL